MTFPDFEEFFASLNAHRVRFLVVGGYAVGFHARPRATKEVDVLIDRTLPNARRTLAALTAFLGSAPGNLTAVKLTNPRALLVLGVAPVRIDVLTSIDGVGSFASLWARRVRASYARAAVNFISRSDLIAAKRAAGRPQDLADVAALERARRRTPVTRRSSDALRAATSLPASAPRWPRARARSRAEARAAGWRDAPRPGPGRGLRAIARGSAP